MIVRNEQSTLPRCLESVLPAVDRIYLTDTGSTDGTLEAAREFGANVRHFAWCDDFAAARNHSITDVAEDWILILDADDWFPPGEAARLREIITASNATTLTLRYEITPGYTPAPTRRVFRNHQGIRFAGLIHESIRIGLRALTGAQTEDTGIQLKHLGQTAASPQKLQRNLPLLEKEWERSKADGDAFQRIHTGKELALTLWQLGREKEGEQRLLQALDEWTGHESAGESGIEALAALIWHYHEKNREDEAWQLCQRFGKEFATTPAFPLYRGLCQFQRKQFGQALDDLRAFAHHWQTGRISIPIPEIYTGLALWDLQGQCLIQTGRAREAIRLFEMCAATDKDNQEYIAKLQLARTLADA